MLTKHILLLALSLFLFSNCKSSDNSKSEEDTTWRDKSAREKLDSMKFNPVLENVSKKIDGLEDRINSVMLIVNYDTTGNIWLTGLGATNQKKVKTVDELSDLLSMVVLKGDASISHVYDKNNHQEKPPVGDSKLEAAILNELRKQGFSVVENR